MLRIPRHISRFCKKIERTHQGSSIPILLQYIAFASKVSLLWIGVMGSGKSTIIENSRLPTMFSNWVDVSLYQVTKTKLTEMLGYQEHKTILLRLTELAHIKGYQRELFIDLVGTLITSRNFDYTLTSKQRLVLRDCDLVVTAGIQPITFMKMTLGDTDWSQFARDRFIKLLLINPLRKTSVKKPPDVDPDILFSKYYTGEVRWGCPKTVLKKVVDLLNEQCSKWRAIEYAGALVVGLTRILGKKRITKEIVDFLYDLLYIYVYPFNKLNVRPSLDEPKRIWGAGLELFSSLANYFGKKALYGVPVNDLARELGVRRRTLMHTLKQFIQLQEESREEGNPIDLLRTELKSFKYPRSVTRKRVVYLAPRFERFFNETYHRLIGQRVGR